MLITHSMEPADKEKSPGGKCFFRRETAADQNTEKKSGKTILYRLLFHGTKLLHFQ